MKSSALIRKDLNLQVGVSGSSWGAAPHLDTTPLWKIPQRPCANLLKGLGHGISAVRSDAAIDHDARMLSLCSL